MLMFIDIPSSFFIDNQTLHLKYRGFKTPRVDTQQLVLYARILGKTYIDNRKVQVAVEMKRDICKYLV